MLDPISFKFGRVVVRLLRVLMSNREKVFSLVASIESDIAECFAGSGEISLKEKLAGVTKQLHGVTGQAASAEFSAAVILALGIVGGLINKDIESRKSQKLVDGGAYAMIDLMAQQIALKSQLGYMLEVPATPARWDGFLANVKELLRGATRLDVVGAQLAKFGELASHGMSLLEDSAADSSFRGALKREVCALAA